VKESHCQESGQKIRQKHFFIIVLFVCNKKKKKMSAVLGLDVSLCSPGGALYITNSNTWLLFCFAQTKRETQLGEEWGKKTTTTTTTRKIVASPTASIFIFPRIQKEASDMERYRQITNTITSWLKTVLHDHAVTATLRTVVEAYAFVPRRIAGHSYKLREITGILKFMLLKEITPMCRVTIETVTVGQWKKALCGSGKVGKRDVLTRVQTVGPCVDLFACFHIIPKDPDKHAPTPLQDMADAVGLVIFHKDIKKKIIMTVCKKRKRKQCQTSRLTTPFTKMSCVSIPKN
jgi:hypothetical protein